MGSVAIKRPFAITVSRDYATAATGLRRGSVPCPETDLERAKYMIARRTPAALLAVSTALALLTPISAQAQQGQDQDCGQRSACSTSSERGADRRDSDRGQSERRESQSAKSKTPSKAEPARTTSREPQRAQPRVVTRATPHVGARVATARYLSTTEKRHLPALPKGQVYRVHDGHVVRVNNDTQKIVAVVGLLTALLN